MGLIGFPSLFAFGLVTHRPPYRRLAAPAGSCMTSYGLTALRKLRHPLFTLEATTSETEGSRSRKQLLLAPSSSPSQLSLHLSTAAFP